MVIHFFKSDINKDMFLENEYFEKSFAPYSWDNESFLGSLLAVPLQIFFEELVYSMKTVAHLFTSLSEFTMALSTYEKPSEHLSKAGENFLHTLAYLLMIFVAPVVAIFRPLIRLVATAEEASEVSPPAYDK